MPPALARTGRVVVGLPDTLADDGAPIAWYMLRRGWVDCEGWDWFSRQRSSGAPRRVEAPAARNRPGMPAVQPTAPAPEPPPTASTAELLAGNDISGAYRAWAASPRRAQLPSAERETLATALADRDR